MTLVRLYTGSDGKSHFEDISVPMSPAAADNPAVEILESKLIATRGVVMSRIVHHDHSGRPHNVPRRQLVVHLAGQTEIEASGGETRWFNGGTVLLAEDTTGAGHITRGVGDEPRVAIFIHLEDGEII